MALSHAGEFSTWGPVQSGNRAVTSPSQAGLQGALSMVGNDAHPSV